MRFMVRFSFSPPGLQLTLVNPNAANDREPQPEEKPYMEMG
jgi:hypothetical protein